MLFQQSEILEHNLDHLKEELNQALNCHDENALMLMRQDIIKCTKIYTDLLCEMLQKSKI